MGFILSDLITKSMGGYAKKPKVPSAPHVSGQDSQLQAAQGNIDALPKLETVADQTNQFNVDQRLKMWEQQLPGYKNLMGAGTDAITGWLNGQLSPDVASAVRNHAQARAVGGGYAGSGMGDNLQARDLGLTSLDLQKMGTQALPGFLGASQIGMPAQYNPAGDFMTTTGQIGLNQWNENNRYGRDWLQNQLDAIPDPAKAAIAKDVGMLANPAGMLGGVVSDVYGPGGGAQAGNALSGYSVGGGGASGAAANTGAAADYGGELTVGGTAAAPAASGGGY